MYSICIFFNLMKFITCADPIKHNLFNVNQYNSEMSLHIFTILENITCFFGVGRERERESHNVSLIMDLAADLLLATIDSVYYCPNTSPINFSADSLVLDAAVHKSILGGMKAHHFCRLLNLPSAEQTIDIY